MESVGRKESAKDLGTKIIELIAGGIVGGVIGFPFGSVIEDVSQSMGYSQAPDELSLYTAGLGVLIVSVAQIIRNYGN